MASESSTQTVSEYITHHLTNLTYGKLPGGFERDDGSVIARQVKTGIQSDELIEIISGVDADDEVVTGSYRAISTDLQNGAQVNVNNDEDGDSNDA